MKSCIISIAKNEDDYLNEWIVYHLNLGIDKIFLIDNNEINNNNQKDICELYKSVYYIDYRGKKMFNYISGDASIQMSLYENVYNKYTNDYDWILFLDVDEFLTLEHHNNINDYLSQEMFNDASLILLNWKCYGDNDKILYEDEPVVTRFTKPYTNLTKYSQNFPENEIVKPILRSKIDNIKHKVHNVYLNNGIVKDSNGNICFNDWRKPITHNNAYIRHYETKSTQEYIKRRILNGDSNKISSINTALNRIKYYFNVNDFNDEKYRLFEQSIKKLMQIYNENSN